MRTSINRSRMIPINQLVLQNKLSVCEPEKYKTLLRSIAIQIGMFEKESSEIVAFACLEGKRNYTQSNGCTLKVLLTKILVHYCIFKICRVHFSNKNACYDPSIVFKIPISLKIVYVLSHSESFTEKEVAYILNITPIQVRERLAKAVVLLQSNRS